MLESSDHQADERGRVGLAGNRVGLWKKKAFETLRGGIQIADESAVVGRFDERGGRAQPVRFENLRHLGDRQAFGEGEGHDEGVAARDLVDHFERRHGAIEPIFPCLQPPPLSAEP